MNHVTNRRPHGFTIIELLLAMTFISVLMLTIALTIVQIANIYNRGLILKEVNATSRSISSELDQAMRASSTFSIVPAANRYISNTWGGRMCLGQYSYIWNYGKAITNNDANRNQYTSANPNGNFVRSGSVSRSEISFVKAPDAGAAYCVANGLGVYPGVNPVGAVELLRTGDQNLAIHGFSIVSSASAQDSLSRQQLFKVSYRLGTSDLTALDDTQTACKPPNVSGSDLNYCSIQAFAIVLRVVSGVN